MGSFRPAVLFRHFHLKFNFTELRLETVRQSLRHSCRTELTRQGISLPSDRQSYSRRLLGLMLKSDYSQRFILQHWAGVRLYTSLLNFAKSCVFSKQSLPPFICHYVKSSFSQSYGVNLPSSFNRILSLPVYTLLAHLCQILYVFRLTNLFLDLFN